MVRYSCNRREYITEIHLENKKLELDNMIKKLEYKADKVAYNNLLELEKLAEKSDAIYEYFDIFLEIYSNAFGVWEE